MKLYNGETVTADQIELAVARGMAALIWRNGEPLLVIEDIVVGTEYDFVTTPTLKQALRVAGGEFRKETT